LFVVRTVGASAYPIGRYSLALNRLPQRVQNACLGLAGDDPLRKALMHTSPEEVGPASRRSHAFTTAMLTLPRRPC
jgi:hypothetical protein